MTFEWKRHELCFGLNPIIGRKHRDSSQKMFFGNLMWSNQQSQSFDLWVKTQHLFGKKMSLSVFNTEYVRDIVNIHSKRDVL